MTNAPAVRHHCPIVVCRWFHETVASPTTPDAPADLTLWTATTWANMSDRPATGLATAHVIDGHLVTHSPVEWMTEMRRLHVRIKSLEQLCSKLSTGYCMTDVESVPAIPSRAEIDAVESIRTQLAGLVGTGGVL
jgi:hypothetical protein